MRNVLTISIWLVLVAVLPAVGGCGKKMPASVPPSDPRIVGVWTLEVGDYPMTKEYRADGTVVQQMGKRTTPACPFRIEGNLLIYTVEQPDRNITEQKEEFQLTDDTLTFI